MRDFFEQKDRAQARTRTLLVLYALAVIVIICAVYFVGMAAFLWFDVRLEYDGPRPGWWNGRAFALVTGATLLVTLPASAWKIFQLRLGGAAVAAMLKGRPVLSNTTHPRERRLLDVVEEMSIASGTPVPAVYVLDEGAINACAAGFSPSDAVLCVTRGALERLDRDELQGVMAHEFSHVLNGDMRLNIWLLGVLHGIMALGLIGKSLMTPRRSGRYADDGWFDSDGGGRRGDNAAAAFFIGALLMAIGALGTLLARMIQSAVSRQREFLADASAVQFTRNPAGIAGALKKTGGLVIGSELVYGGADTNHFFFGRSVAPSLVLSDLLDSHPSLAERVRRLDPGWDGKFVEPTVTPDQVEGEWERGMGRFGVVVPAAAAVLPTPDQLLESAGDPQPEHIVWSHDLLAALPAAIREAAREPLVAQAIVYAVLLDRDERSRGRQLEHLRHDAVPGAAAEVERLHPEIEKLGPGARLPLVDLVLPALREMSRAQYRAFDRNVERLVEMDPGLDVFTFALGKLLARNLRAVHERVTVPPVQHRSTAALAAECALILSTLAHSGHKDPAAARAAFAASARLLALPGGRDLLPPEQCGLAAFGSAVDRLTRADLATKRKVLGALGHCVAHDGKLVVAEVELVRAIADALDCPLPPSLAEKAGGTPPGGRGSGRGALGS